MTNAETKQLAAKIARVLFTEGGTNRVAARLVMGHAGGWLGGGWGEGPMAARIEKTLREWKPR